MLAVACFVVVVLSGFAAAINDQWSYNTLIESCHQAAGAVLVETSDGVYRLRRDGTGRLEKVKGIPSDHYEEFQPASRAFLVGAHGLYRLRADGTGDGERVPGIPANHHFGRTFYTASASLLVVTDNGLFRLAADGTGNAEKVNGISNAYPYPEGFYALSRALLFATDEGLYRFRPDGTGDADEVKGISHESIFKVHSASAALLIGGRNGIYRLRPDGTGDAEKVRNVSLERAVSLGANSLEIFHDFHTASAALLVASGAIGKLSVDLRCLSLFLRHDVGQSHRIQPSIQLRSIAVTVGAKGSIG